MTDRHLSDDLSRREAIRLIGLGAGLGLTAACQPGTAPEVEPEDAAAAPSAAPTFPDGAIIRTVLGDITPESLADGATLFHEHLSFNYSSPPPPRRLRESGALPPPPPDNPTMLDLLVEELRMAAFDGVGCIVDSSIGPRTELQLENMRTLSTRSGRTSWTVSVKG